MSVTKKDRDEYEEGRRDRDRNVVNQAVIDIFGNRSDSDAYHKGRDGEQLDEDADSE